MFSNQTHPSSQTTEPFACKFYYLSLWTGLDIFHPVFLCKHRALTPILFYFFVCRLSKSEYNPSNPPKAQSEPSQQVSMYCVSELVCEDSEYSFEELRANRYFAKCKQQAELRKLGKCTSKHYFFINKRLDRIIFAFRRNHRELVLFYLIIN